MCFAELLQITPRIGMDTTKNFLGSYVSVVSRQMMRYEGHLKEIAADQTQIIIENSERCQFVM